MILTKKVRLWPTDMLKWGHISLCKINEHYQNERKTNTRTSLPSGTSRELVQACAVRALPRNRWIQVMVIILWVRLQKVPSIFDGWPSSSPLNLSQLWVFSISHSWTHPYHITLVIYIYILCWWYIYIYHIQSYHHFMSCVFQLHPWWLVDFQFFKSLRKVCHISECVQEKGNPRIHCWIIIFQTAVWRSTPFSGTQIYSWWMLMTSYRSTSVPPFWPDKSPCGLEVFKWFMLTKGSTIVFFRRANPKRCRIVNVATIWVGFLTFYCSIFLGFDCGKANVINLPKMGDGFSIPPIKMGSQGLPHYIYIYIYIYMIYIYVYIYIYTHDICIWYIWQCHLLIPQIIPKTSLPGTWKKAEPSEVRHQARREGIGGVSWFHGDFMGILVWF